MASDVLAIWRYAGDILFRTDDDIAVLSAEGVRVMNHGGRPIGRLAWTRHDGEPGYQGFMQKEITDSLHRCPSESQVREECIARPLLAAGGQDI